MRVRAEIFAFAKSIPVGQSMRFSGIVMREAFPTMAMVEERPPEDQFLENMVAANYGAWTCTYDLLGDFYTIGHHEPGTKQVRRDFDRRHIPL